MQAQRMTYGQICKDRDIGTRKGQNAESLSSMKRCQGKCAAYNLALSG